MPSRRFRVAIVGATGAVGAEFARVLAQRNFPAASYKLLASPRSAGKQIDWMGTPTEVQALGPTSFDDVDIAFFSAGASVSREYAPYAAQSGAIAIDNSSAFRMDPGTPLVVPEVNPGDVRDHKGIIANPNCSTIIMHLPLWPLHQANPVRRVVVCTYQAASGAGARALAELEAQTRDVLAGQLAKPQVFPVPCAFNVFSHNTPVGDDGLNTEERKMVQETHKIFHDSSIGVAPICMRVPVLRAHTEALSIEFTNPITVDQAREVLSRAPGVKIVDDPANNRFPTPLDATGHDEVLVGRVHGDASFPDGRGLKLICAGDQLRKGAALNAVQIAELL